MKLRSLHDHPDVEKPTGSAAVAYWVQHKVGTPTSIVVHAIWFWFWMCFVEIDPWPTLTLIVSLEAIFLALTLLVGQNYSEHQAAQLMDGQQKILSRLDRLQVAQCEHMGIPVEDSA